MSVRSFILVTVQLICIAVLVVTGPVIPGEIPSLAVTVVGTAVIVWAVALIRLPNLRIQPEPGAQATLVTRGPFHLIRHPMYSGGMLIALGWVWNEFSLVRLAAALVLLLDFILKMRFEEQLLSERFSEYAEYKRRTKKLVPFVW